MENESAEKSPYTVDDFNVIYEEEKKYIRLGPEEKKYGLAFSGGGIRSASFGLGVMQGLVAGRKLEKMHYLSTVSGGGYLGTALTWALHQGGADVGTDPDKFPLGDKEHHTGHSRNKTGNALLDYIRQHSSYLTPTSKLGLVSFVGAVLRSVSMSLIVYVSLLFAVMGMLHAFGAFETTMISDWFGVPHHYLGGEGIFIPLAVLLMAAYVILNCWYSLLTFFKLEKITTGQKYLDFLSVQIIIGYIWKAIIPLLLIGSMPFFLDGLEQAHKAIIASGSTTLGFIVSIWQYRKAQKEQEEEESSGVMSDLAIYIGAFALIYGLLWGSFMVGRYCTTVPETINGITTHHTLPLQATLFCLGTLLISGIFGVFVNLNLISPSRIWRNRLMEAFMPDAEAVKENVWMPARKADNALMEEMCAEPHQRPYHLINTNIILVDSADVEFKGRGGDNFMISRLFCGSRATGWRKTDSTHGEKTRRISLATAMATSAAAVNPNAGVSGEGATRNAIVSVMFSILNIRLGYWTTNPRYNPWKLPPNFFMPGMTSEIIRAGLRETRRNIQLSDGGHFENLAIYELIRRELDVIVLSDGGADGRFNFDDLANAVEKVRVDFGTKIVFRYNYGLDQLLPESAEKSDYVKKYGIAQRGFAIADVEYCSGKKGLLFYIKLTMIRNLPTDVYSYKGMHPEFPHESTADQFFDEKQFEAYRELGYRITKSLLEAKGEDDKPLLD